MNSGELLSKLNSSVDRQHHQAKPNHQNPTSVPDSQTNPTSHSNAKSASKQESAERSKQQNIAKQNGSATESQELGSASSQLEHSDSQRTENATRMSNLSKATSLRQTNNKTTDFKSRLKPSDMAISEEDSDAQIEGLHEILLHQIDRIVSEPLAEIIEATLKQRERRTYVAYTQNDLSYLHNLHNAIKQKSEDSLQMVKSLMSRRHSKAEDLLTNGELFIDLEKNIKSRDHAEQLHKLDVARMLKIKDGTIRSKLDLLNDKMFEFDELGDLDKSKLKEEQTLADIKAKIKEYSDPSNFDLNSEKTKIANDYVKHLHQQKLLILKKMRDRERKRVEREKKREQEIKEAEQLQNISKRQSITQRISQTKESREKEALHNKQQTQRAESLLSQYRKSLPLYKKKEKEFARKYLVKEEKERQQKLKELKNYRSMSLNEIKEHEQKYLSKKNESESKREEEFKLLMKSRNSSENNAPKYFKGFFHDKVTLLDKEEKFKFYSLRESSKQKVDRMIEFNKQTKKKHVPKVDPKKKQQLLKMIEMQELKRRRVRKVTKEVPTGKNGEVRIEVSYEEIPEMDTKKEGNKNMQICKSLASKRPEQKQEESQRNQGEQDSRVSQRRRSQIQVPSWEDPLSKVSQEKDMWRLRGRKLTELTEQVNAHNFDQIKKKVEVLDSQAMKKEELLKYRYRSRASSKDGMNESLIEDQEQLHEKGMLDEFYFDSIKNKLKLLEK